MYHVALTPNEYPANALSAKAPTLIAALGELFKALDVLELNEDCVAHVLEAAKEAVDNLEDDEPAKGTWTDMGSEDDAFSIDIFCADDAQYVKFDDDYLLVPHGAVGLAIGELNFQRWIYDESELPEWDNVLLPQGNAGCDNCGMFDRVEGSKFCEDCKEAIERGADAKITELIRDVKDGDCALSAIFDDGSTRKLFNFFIDELAFFDADLLGKTETEAHQLHSARIIAYIQS